MQPRWIFPPVSLLILGVAVFASPQSAIRRGAGLSGGQEAVTIRCRALETHASDERGVTIVVFHQEAKEDQKHLSDLLKQFSEATVEWQRGGDKWENATVIRLKTCFGRGLLMIPSTMVAPKDGESFLLRFPAPIAATSK